MSKIVPIDWARDKRDAKKYRFTPKSATEQREALARLELISWLDTYKDLGFHFIAEQGQGLCLVADEMKMER